MGFLSPKAPPPPAVAPPISKDPSRAEADRLGERDKQKRKKSSSYDASKRVSGAVNPNYSTGTKTAQGQ